MNDYKLYLVTRRDLSFGDQTVQTCHVALQFAVDHPSTTERWTVASNTLVLLTVADEAALHALVERADYAGLDVSRFCEPDLGGALTAVALEPSAGARKLCRGLPLALACAGSEALS